VNVDVFWEWLERRKKKGALNTLKAVKSLIKNLEAIHAEKDLNAQESVLLATEMGWKSVNVKWVRNQNGNNQSWGNSKRVSEGYLQQLQKISENITEN